MFKEVVEVIDKKQDELTVKFEKSTMCSCCRHSFLCSLQKEAMVVKNSQNCQVEVGDKVEVGIEEKKTLGVSAVLFFVPAIVFILALVGFRGFGELKSFILAVVLVSLYYLLVKLWLKKIKPNLNFNIIRKV